MILRDRNFALTSFLFDHKYWFAFLKRGHPEKLLPVISLLFDFHSWISWFFGPLNGSHFGNITFFVFSRKFPGKFQFASIQKFRNFVEWKTSLLSDCSLKYTHAELKFSLREDVNYRKEKSLTDSYLALFSQSVDEIVCSCVVDVWNQNRRILRNGGLWIFVHWNLTKQGGNMWTGPREKLKRGKSRS